MERRPFVVPRALGGSGRPAVEEEESEEDDEAEIEANDNGRKRLVRLG